MEANTTLRCFPGREESGQKRPFEVMGTADTKTGREESTGCLPSRQLSMVRAQTALGKKTGGMPMERN